MHAQWEIDDAALEKWRQLVDENQGKSLVVERKTKNVLRRNVDYSKAEVWRVMVGCQVTTMQKSGPDSSVGRFMERDNSSRSTALDYLSCKRSANLKAFLAKELRAAGLWRAEPISKNLTGIMNNLEAGAWRPLLDHLTTLESNTTKAKERRVAQFLQSKLFPGIGPKQSRNFIQWLGLARYEVPIDSRVLKVLRRHGASLIPGASALGDEGVYVFVQDALQLVAKRLDIYPCILDACIFASFEKQ